MTRAVERLEVPRVVSSTFADSEDVIELDAVLVVLFEGLRTPRKDILGVS